MKIRTRGMAITILCSLMLIFQNCTPDSKSDSSTKPQKIGGEGYEGKVYVAYAPNPCSDGSKVEMRMRIASDGAYVLRENCANLATARRIAGFKPNDIFKFELDGKTFELEFIDQGLQGYPTPDSTLGVYAPAVTVTSLGLASKGQAAPWGNDYVLAAVGIGRYDYLVTSCQFRLMKRSHGSFVELDRKSINTFGVEPDFMDPLLNLMPLSDERALLFLKQYGPNDEVGFQVYLITRNGETLDKIVAGPHFTSEANGVSGQALDADRALIAFPGESNLVYLVIDTAGNTFRMGAPLSGPSAALTLAKDAANNPAFLATTNPNEFMVIKENNGLQPSTAGLFVLRADGLNLTATNYSNLPAPKGNTRGPVAIGDRSNAVLLLQSGDYYSWLSVAPSQITFRGNFSYGDITGEWFGLSSMATSRNLFSGGLAFVHLPNMGDERVRFFDPETGRHGFFNIHLPRSWHAGTARLFISGDRLVLLSIVEGEGRLISMTIPGREVLK